MAEDAARGEAHTTFTNPIASGESQNTEERETSEQELPTQQPLGAPSESEVPVVPAEQDPRVNIRNVMLDTQAYRGVNSFMLRLLVLHINFSLLAILTQPDLAKNNIQLRKWAMPGPPDLRNAKTTAEFAARLYSDVQADPLVDGHNRVLLAYAGTYGWGSNAGHWPTSECQMGNMFLDKFGKIQGEHPFARASADEWKNYELPCDRTHGHCDTTLTFDGSCGSATEAAHEGSEHFATPILEGRYNFSAVMHWFNHDYPVLYASSLKHENRSQIRREIEAVGKFIAEMDPSDLRIGFITYNPQLKLATDIEIQLDRTEKTSYRKASIVVFGYMVDEYGSDYRFYGAGIVLCFLISAVRVVLEIQARATYTQHYKLVMSDYTWKRWTRNENPDGNSASRRHGEAVFAVGCPCLASGTTMWSAFEVAGCIVMLLQLIFIITEISEGYFGLWEGSNIDEIWQRVPAANTADTMGEIDVRGWNELFWVMKSGLFPNAARGAFSQQMLVGLSCLAQTFLVLRDLQWHHGLGVFMETLKYASKDLQDVLIVTVILLGGFSSLGVTFFGSFGTQDIFNSLGNSFQTLFLLGFGKSVDYDDVVNDNLGVRFDGVGLGKFAQVKVGMFWVLLVIFIFVIREYARSALPTKWN